MESKETLNILAKLTREQSFVLYRKLQGDSHVMIGLSMNLSADRVQQFSSQVYKAFGIDGRNWNGLRDATSEIMGKVAKPSDWKDWKWPTMELLAEIGKDIPKQSDNSNQRKSPFLEKEWEKSVTEIAGKWYYQVAAVVLVVVLAIVLWPRNPPQTPAPAQATDPTHAPQVAFVITDTQRPTATITRTPTITFTPTITRTPAPTNTPTLTPTFTITPTFTSTPNYFLNDDFNDLSDKWTVYGDAQFVDGTVKSLDQNDIWLVTDLPKDNYSIEVSINGGASGTYTGAIVAPVYKDSRNYTGVRSSANMHGWVKAVNWYWGNSEFVNVTTLKHLFKIKVDGKKMSAHLNDLDLGSYIETGEWTGKLGIRLDAFSTLDYVRIVLE
jgi:hypothetical protein